MKVSRERLQRLSAATGLATPVLYAIANVESGGNDAAMRFEPHKFLAARPDLKGRIPYTPKGPGKPWSNVKSETNRAAFDKAYALDPKAAIEASSWGRFQVMGWALLKDAPEPAVAMARFDKDPAAVSDALLKHWMDRNPQAKAAAAAKNWTEFARIYNGPANVDAYTTKYTAAYAEGVAEERKV
jgi:hypothetical protein